MRQFWRKWQKNGMESSGAEKLSFIPHVSPTRHILLKRLQKACFLFPPDNNNNSNKTRKYYIVLIRAPRAFFQVGFPSPPASLPYEIKRLPPPIWKKERPSPPPYELSPLCLCFNLVLVLSPEYDHCWAQLLDLSIFLILVPRIFFFSPCPRAFTVVFHI